MMPTRIVPPHDQAAIAEIFVIWASDVSLLESLAATPLSRRESVWQSKLMGLTWDLFRETRQSVIRSRWIAVLDGLLDGRRTVSRGMLAGM
jgi:hypothetical protein